MRSDRSKLPRAVALGAALLLTSGCARSVREASVADAFGGIDITSELDFWDELASQDAVTNRDALHALLLTFELLSAPEVDDENEAEGEPAAPRSHGFEDELAIAQQRGWIDADAVVVANETAQVGWIARAICLEEAIEGGVNLRLFGPIPRYALRELQHEQLLSTKSENQAISGLELMATIGRIGDRNTGLVSAPRQEF